MQQLGYMRTGNPEGRPLALIHGWGCDASFLMPVAFMFPERDVYLIDLPGYGRSAHLADCASDLVRSTYLLINTIPDGADIVSWSLGTLYVLHALSIINDPGLNYRDFASHPVKGLTVKNTCPYLYSINSAGQIRNLFLEDRGLNHNLVFNCRNRSQDLHISYLREKLQESLTVTGEMHNVYSTLRSSVNEISDNSAGYGDHLSALSADSYGSMPFQHKGTADPVKTKGDPYASAEHTENSSHIKVDSKIKTATRYSLIFDDRLAKHLNKNAGKALKLRIPSVRSLVTVCGSPRFPSDPNWPGINPALIVKMRTLLDGRRLKLILNFVYKQMQLDAALTAHPEFSKYMCTDKCIDKKILLSGINQISYMDERAAFERLSIPSLHLFGANDRLVPHKVSEFCPHNSLHGSFVFPYSAHVPFITEPETFEKRLREFFEQIRHL